MRALAAALLAVTMVLPQGARDFWLTPDEYFVSPGQRLTVLVHLEDSVVPPRLLRDAALYTAKGIYNVVNLRAEGSAVAGEATIPSGGTLLLTVRTEPHTLAGERLLGFAKAIIQSDTPDGGFSRVAGLGFEIVPEANPGAIGPYPIRLLLEGKAAPDIEVRVGRDAGPASAAGRTDAAGRIEINIPGPGKYRILAAVRRRAHDTRNTGWEHWSTSLTFAVPDPAAQPSL